MFRKILIANRGEIAIRVMRTARRLGIRTVAIFSEADAAALHVEMADEAWCVGGAASRDSYLNGDRILDVARRTGAEGLHPGYGFLSENADFAEACEDAGVVFIGPPPSAIRAMGSKAAAKAIMESAGVPLVPGYHGDLQDAELLASEAERVGYPILIKAVAGGGGKGMRAVPSPLEFQLALAGARSEAAASFGDDRVLIERYLTHPRHIEIQVFADSAGNTVSLFERDCSIQRRHQKVLEEAPAPGVNPSRRSEMGEAACAAARAVGYVGAGTVEFIAQDGLFFFMEMNTRLQVEHPVTEMVTGLDLVEWQLRIACGEKLPVAQDDISLEGHAIEARIYAEDPGRNFMPSIGRIRHLHQPSETGDVRIDSGVREGDDITSYYDPMIAKLIVHGANRPEALRRLSGALGEFDVLGVKTNLSLLRAVTAHPNFASGQFDTGFIANHPEVLEQPEISSTQRLEILAAATALILVDMHDAGKADAALTADPFSPWAAFDSWRVDETASEGLLLELDGMQEIVSATRLAHEHWQVFVAGASIEVSYLPGERTKLRIGDTVKKLRVSRWDGNSLSIFGLGEPAHLTILDPLAPPRSEARAGKIVASPIPGRVTRVLVGPGDTIAASAALLVIEAMKMEITLTAPADGIIDEVRCSPGDMVEEGRQLVTFKDE